MGASGGNTWRRSVFLCRARCSSLHPERAVGWGWADPFSELLHSLAATGLTPGPRRSLNARGFVFILSSSSSSSVLLKRLKKKRERDGWKRIKKKRGGIDARCGAKPSGMQSQDPPLARRPSRLLQLEEEQEEGKGRDESLSLLRRPLFEKRRPIKRRARFACFSKVAFCRLRPTRTFPSFPLLFSHPPPPPTPSRVLSF